MFVFHYSLNVVTRSKAVVNKIIKNNIFKDVSLNFCYIDKTVHTYLLFTMHAFIDYTCNIFIINLLVMRAHCPPSSSLKRVYEHSITSAYSQSAVLSLPFVNMDANNLSTMNMCILYASEQRNKWG